MPIQISLLNKYVAYSPISKYRMIDAESATLLFICFNIIELHIDQFRWTQLLKGIINIV